MCSSDLCVIHNLIWKLDSSEGNLPAETVSFGYGGSDKEIGDNNDTSEIKLQKRLPEVLAERGHNETDEE